MEQLTREQEIKIVQSIKTELLFDFQNHIRNGILGLISKNMAYNSNRIEGSSLTPDQTSSLFDTGTFLSEAEVVYRAKDIEEMNGHFKMFNKMLSTLEEPISETLMKDYHFQLKSGVFEDMANGYAVGDFKKRPNIVGNQPTVPPSEVPSRIRQLILDYQENTDSPLEAVTKFHAGFEAIHPFQDGNGRVGRMLLFRQCLDKNIIPVLVPDDKKLIYMKALQESRNQNFEPLCQAFQSFQSEFLTLVKPMLAEELFKK